MSTWVWIIVAIIVVLALAALLAGVAGKKRREQRRVRADELREQAAAQATGVEQQEARAREAEAEAARARAEAERLEAEAQDKQASATEARERHDHNLREADRLDPDVKHSAPTTAPDSAPEEPAGTTETAGPARSDRAGEPADRPVEQDPATTTHAPTVAEDGHPGADRAETTTGNEDTRPVTDEREPGTHRA